LGVWVKRSKTLTVFVGDGHVKGQAMQGVLYHKVGSPMEKLEDGGPVAVGGRIVEQRAAMVKVRAALLLVVDVDDLLCAAGHDVHELGPFVLARGQGYDGLTRIGTWTVYIHVIILYVSSILRKTALLLYSLVASLYSKALHSWNVAS
jgi:hypothetical protein